MGDNDYESAMDEELKPQPASAPEEPAQPAASAVEERARHASASGRMPTLYIGHGAPLWSMIRSGSPNWRPGLRRYPVQARC